MDTRTDIKTAFNDGTLAAYLSRKLTAALSNAENNSLQADTIELHNSGLIDLISAAVRLTTSQADDYDFWLIQGFYTSIIPDLQVEPEALVQLVRHLVTLAGNDLAGGRPYGAFRTWASQPPRALAVLERLDPQADQDTPFFSLALEALASDQLAESVKLALQSLDRSKGSARANGAIIALGNLSSHYDSALAISVFEALCESALEGEDEPLSVTVFALVQLLATANENEDRFIEQLESVSSRIGQATIHRLATGLFRHGETISANAVKVIAKPLALVKSEHHGTLREIDFAASAFVQKGRVVEGRSIVEPILKRSEDPINKRVFRGFFEALLSCDRATVDATAVDWLLSGDHQLSEAVNEVVSAFHDEPFVVETPLRYRALSHQEVIVLSKRAIGYLFIHPITAASILLSLLPTVAQETREQVGNLLFDPLLINYTGDLANWLRMLAPDTDAVVAEEISRALQRVEAYLDGLRRAKVVPELAPSERERLIEVQRQQREMQEAHKVAHAESTLASLFPKSVLLYGTRSISYVTGPNGERKRHEYPLHTLSHSIEAPRQNRLEPAQLDLTLRFFRAAKVQP